MAGYVKRIALIKTLKAGYSADGGELKGLVRCEAYAGYFKAEASLINFAPLTEGCYRIGITDGSSAVIFDSPAYEGECPFDPTDGFACLITFCRAGSVAPVACAVCGDNQKLLASVQSAIEHEESAARTSYDDEAIADENYYDLETDKDGSPVRPPEEARARCGADAHEETAGAVESAPSAGAEQQNGQGAESGEKPIKCATSAFRIGGTPEESGEKFRTEKDGQVAAESGPDDEPAQPKLAGGGFYERMSGDIKKIFSTYPRAEALEDVIDGSRWAKITYGNGAHYAFGVIYDGGNAKYLCYGVPVASGAPCPESLKGRAAYVPVDGGGYWVMYQDAETGISIKPC